MKDVNIELFEKYPKKEFQLVAILDIDLKYPNYFIALFNDINENKTYQEKIIPELFRKKFKIGNVYKNNKLIKLGNYYEDVFNIDINGNERYKKFSEVLNKYKYHIDEYYLKYFSKQLCYVIESEDKTIVIPCNTIAIRYYFLSATFKEAYNAGNFDKLYYHDSNKYIPSIDTYQIDVTLKSNVKDIPFMCRFLKDKAKNTMTFNGYSFDSFTFFYRNKSKQYTKYKKPKNETLYSTLLCRFPIKDQFDIHCKYLVLTNKEDHPVYFITDIYNDNSTLGFSNLHVRRYKKGTPSGDIEKIPFTKTLFKGRDKGETKTQTTKIVGSSPKIIEETLVEKAHKDLNTQDLTITNEDIYTGTGVFIETKANTVNTIPSFNDTESTGPSRKDVQKILNKEVDDMSDPFLLSHFTVLFEELRQRAEIIGSELNHPVLMQRISNKVRKGWNEKSLLNKEESTPRPYLYGYFEFNDKYVYFIELQEDKTWKQSTWFFVSDAKIDFNEDISFDIIKYYILNPRYIDLYNYCWKDYSLSLFLKKHTKNIYSEDHVDNWCDGIFELANLTNGERKNKIKKEK